MPFGCRTYPTEAPQRQTHQTPVGHHVLLPVVVMTSTTIKEEDLGSRQAWKKGQTRSCMRVRQCVHDALTSLHAPPANISGALHGISQYQSTAVHNTRPQILKHRRRYGKGIWQQTHEVNTSTFMRIGHNSASMGSHFCKEYFSHDMHSHPNPCSTALI